MNLTVGFAAPRDDAAIRGLLRRQTMAGRVRLALCREPEFALGCAVTGDDPRILVARAGREIVGVACRSTRQVFLNGRARRIGYLGQLRVDERFRGRWLVARGFAMLAQLEREDPATTYLASIVDGNDEATGVLVERPRRSFPAFREVARYCTLAIRVTASKAPLKAGGEIVAATRDQIRDLVAFLQTHGARRHLFPVWTEEQLARLSPLGLALDDIRVARHRGAIAGVIALWDQSAYKQSIVRGYSGWLRALAPVLPPVGRELRSAYASLVCTRDDDAGLFAALLREVYNLASARGFEYLLVGLDVRDPRLPCVRAYRHFTYPSRLYLASWRTGGHTHDQLDDRPAYVDIASL